MSYFVKKHNNLNKAYIGLSLIQYRLILLASSSKFTKEGPITPETLIRINAHDYHEIYGTSNDMTWSYRVIKEAAISLFEAHLSFQTIDAESNKGLWKEKVRWVSKCAYNDELKAVELRFTVDVLPYIQELSENYTYFALKSMSRLGSLHSIRLYELAVMWRKSGKTQLFSIPELKSMLNIREDEYEDTKSFTRSVLKKSCEEISKKTDINLTYEPEKEGRKIVGFRLISNANKPQIE